jgi:ectoine hydroxylase-related dioxygenase (phytanoyl-CoA dioxygenase family)
MDWTDDLRSSGYAHFRNLVPAGLVETARQAIEHDLATNYDPVRKEEYESRTFCPDLCDTPAIMDVLLKSPLFKILDEVLGLNNIVWGNGQIAVRRAHNYGKPLPPTPHLDGSASGLNGVPEGRIYNHTALVGVFLTPLVKSFAGNFTVWPGSHYKYETYFRQRGRAAFHEPMPELELGSPVQLMCNPGDAVLAHYQLGHSAAINMSDVDRIAIYFRVRLKDVDADPWRFLTDIWRGWRE